MVACKILGAAEEPSGGVYWPGSNEVVVHFQVESATLIDAYVTVATL